MGVSSPRHSPSSLSIQAAGVVDACDGYASPDASGGGLAPSGAPPPLQPYLMSHPSEGLSGPEDRMSWQGTQATGTGQQGQQQQAAAAANATEVAALMHQWCALALSASHPFPQCMRFHHAGMMWRHIFVPMHPFLPCLNAPISPYAPVSPIQA